MLSQNAARAAAAPIVNVNTKAKERERGHPEEDTGFGPREKFSVRPVTLPALVVPDFECETQSIDQVAARAVRSSYRPVVQSGKRGWKFQVCFLLAADYREPERVA